MIYNILRCLLLLGAIVTTMAAPYNGESFEFGQPDGSLVPVRVFGDEFLQRVETPDGFTLIRNPATGWICYAALSADSSELYPTDRIYQPSTTINDTSLLHKKHLWQHRAARLIKHASLRTRLLGKEDEPSGVLPAPAATIQPLPGVKAVTGSYTGLTIIIDFSDKASAIPADSIKDLLNKRNYTGFRNNGSVRDYYSDVSGGKIDYQNVVFGYFRAAKAKTYYDASSASFGVRAQELILEALKWLDKEGFDFSTLSTDARKRVLAVNFMYAGTPSQGWSEGLWPHQGNLSGFTADGVTVRRYQITNIGSSLSIGTFCHENGHMLFAWPDLYDYGGESAGAGGYCIMCTTDDKNPVSPCAYLRDYAGWDVVTDITTIAQGTMLTHLPNSNTSFVYRNSAATSEMYYVEGRRRTGRSKMLPDSGFLVLHIDQKGSNDNEKRTATAHYLVSVVQADNAFDLEKGVNNGKAGDLFRKGYKDRFDDSTKPPATWWNGKTSGLKLWNMSGVGDTMSFSIGELPGSSSIITAAAGAHGTINPSGKITIAIGSAINFVIKPDSGYQIDEILVDGVAAAISDTLKFDNVTAAKTITVAFGQKSAISILTPSDGDVLYAGDTAIIKWRARGITVQGFTISSSINGGKTFSAVATNLPATDSLFSWIVPDSESDSCRLRIADSDGTPASTSGPLSIKTKPVIDLSSVPVAITIEKGVKKQQTLSIGNKGKGRLKISAATAVQMKQVLINELSVGTDTDAPDAIELWNSGADIDISGWELTWEDNKTTSGSYRFPEGYLFTSGTTILVHDNDSLNGKDAIYAGKTLQWRFSDSLQLAVTLTDASGRGIDFVKTKGSADLPPDGTVWEGNGIELCSAFVYRIAVIDSNAATDWVCGGRGSLSKPNNPAQIPVLPSLAITPSNSNLPASTNGSLTISVDATALDTGNYGDMIVLFHNDPAVPSPIRIPCMVTVLVAAAVKFPRATSPERSAPPSSFLVAPNPAAPGEPITFHYMPTGDEASATLYIHTAMGTVCYTAPVDVTHIRLIQKKPVIFTWNRTTAREQQLRLQTCIARLFILTKDGEKRVISTAIGLQ